ncbi:MAG: SMP-30/gluconolactonase/LRE family protein [Comamonadaceae bacterium]|nr:MAG: SMP-30/gluconolactonase/LRE family protein [Comamonadaceae bacterium]
MTWQALTLHPPRSFALGESPFWHPHELMLYWVDIEARQVHRCNIFMGTLDSWAMPSEPGCIAPASGGGLVIALRDGIYRGRDWGGALERIAPFDHDTGKIRFNDGKADPLGRFWASTIYEPRDARDAALFSVDGRGAGKPVVTRQAGDATVGNGLAFSPDAKTLYWTDTTSHTIRAWDWDADANALSGERIFKQWPAKPEGWKPGDPGYAGRPDGGAVDAAGNYYAAMFEGAQVVKLSPAGEVLAKIPVPAQCPTMPCFGGDDLKTLYLTTARHNRPAAELEKYPLSGCVLSMQVDVPGLPVNFYQD